MPASEPNPGLDRVRRALRSNRSAVGATTTQAPHDAANALRSGILSRGYLPHLKREGASYFVTFRLADSLPQEVLLGFKQEQAGKLRSLPDQGPTAREAVDREFQRQIERYLDLGVGACHLKRPDVAQIVAEALLHFHNQQYLFEEWVIMPNHVHIVLWPMPNHTLSDILRSRKRHTARRANLILGRTGETFWQHESHDHWIRDDEEKARIRRYIRHNPVQAGLCRSPEEWPWGSAFLKKDAKSGS